MSERDELLKNAIEAARNLLSAERQFLNNPCGVNSRKHVEARDRLKEVIAEYDNNSEEEQ